jgi:hypothetical protein
MAADILRLTVLKHMLNKVREWIGKAGKWMPPEDSPCYRVRYLSIPLWKPWRDY